MLFITFVDRTKIAQDEKTWIRSSALKLFGELQLRHGIKSN